MTKDASRYDMAVMFLKSLGAGKVSHAAERSLLAHLTAVFDVLHTWGHPHHIALAGLMHSIYGTDAFTHACLPPDKRDDVRAVIGDDAERLAYLFSALEREPFLAGLDQNSIASRFGDGPLAVTRDEMRLLCEILFANEYDLAIAKKGLDRPDKIEKKLAPVYTILSDYLSPAAHSAYRKAIMRPG